MDSLVWAEQDRQGREGRTVNLGFGFGWGLSRLAPRDASCHGLAGVAPFQRYARGVQGAGGYILTQSTVCMVPTFTRILFFTVASSRVTKSSRHLRVEARAESYVACRGWTFRWLRPMAPTTQLTTCFLAWALPDVVGRAASAPCATDAAAPTVVMAVFQCYYITICIQDHTDRSLY